MDTDTTPGEETGHEERKVIDVQTRATESRETRIEASRAGVRSHLKKFQTTYKTLSDATLTFREQIAETSIFTHRPD